MDPRELQLTAARAFDIGSAGFGNRGLAHTLNW
jgi:hypothetical protein